ncbi:MAG: precorrin-3B C(17)-methyltransferase [Deltaproteobacteria bacterium]|nr:MAG: precorrin-3B C(17)-methyltransferase [Deltaproteobacteria bacterium]
MKGHLSVVSTGPGDEGNLTPRSREELLMAEVIAGYGTYLDQISSLLEGKTVISTGMRDEAGRCNEALKQARSGKRVCLISGGDAGVYGLSGLMLELMTPEEQADLLVIPGVTSATACAALLGAPLIHDFAVISLSNLLTEDSLIEKRLRLAAEGDFVTILYNPRSTKRHHLFSRAAEIYLGHRAPEIPVGLVRNAYREEQRIAVVPLDELNSCDWVDMHTTVVIGNSQTFISGGRMITPRGYAL